MIAQLVSGRGGGQGQVGRCPVPPLSHCPCYLSPIRAQRSNSLQSSSRWEARLEPCVRFLELPYKMPQMGWLKQQKCVLAVLGAGSPGSRCGQGWFLLGL